MKGVCVKPGDLCKIKYRVPVYSEDWHTTKLPHHKGYTVPKQLAIVLEVLSSGCVKILTTNIIGYIDGDELHEPA